MIRSRSKRKPSQSGSKPGGWRRIETAINRLSEIDIARARLIHDLKNNIGVNDEAVPLILDLIDQLHGLRRAMRNLVKRKDL